MDIYQENGYRDRVDYLESLVSTYGASRYLVFSLADILGPSEDFDGLINALEDYERTQN